MMKKLVITVLVLATGLTLAPSCLGQDSGKVFDANIFLRRKVDSREGYPTLRSLFDVAFVDSVSHAYRLERVRKLFEIMKEHEANGTLAEYFEFGRSASDRRRLRRREKADIFRQGVGFLSRKAPSEPDLFKQPQKPIDNRLMRTIIRPGLTAATDLMGA